MKRLALAKKLPDGRYQILGVADNEVIEPKNVGINVIELKKFMNDVCIECRSIYDNKEKGCSITCSVLPNKVKEFIEGKLLKR